MTEACAGTDAGTYVRHCPRASLYTLPGAATRRALRCLSSCILSVATPRYARIVVLVCNAALRAYPCLAGCYGAYLVACLFGLLCLFVTPRYARCHLLQLLFLFVTLRYARIHLLLLLFLFVTLRYARIHLLLFATARTLLLVCLVLHSCFFPRQQPPSALAPLPADWK
jgi:hypothetical protein